MVYIKVIFFGGSSVSVGTDIYLIGSFADQNLNCKYDTLKDKYTRLKNIPYGVYMGAVTAIGTDIYIFGTGNSGNNQYLAYKYDTLTDTYTKLTNSSYPVGLGAAFAISNNNEINMFVLYSQRVQIMTLITTEFENNSLIIQNGTNYKTELYTNSEIIGKVNNTFTNVLHYTTLNGIEDTISYYGNGTDWLPLRPITSIELDETMLYMETGDNLTLNVTIVPNNASDRELIWSSSDTSVATVSSNGLVTKVADGSAVITCSSIDGSGTSTTCTVDTYIHVTSVLLNYNSATVWQYDTLQLNATIYPNNATNKNITWSSSNTSIATVDDTGLVMAKALGTCTITVTTEDESKIATCTITVLEDSLDNYYELEYIEGTGSQWIDTGVKATSNIKMQLKAIPTSSIGNIFLGEESNGDSADYRLFFTGGNMYFDRGYDRLIAVEPINTTYELEIGEYYVKDLTTGNDILNGYITTFDFSSHSANIGLLNYLGGSTAESGKIYYLKIFDNNVLIRDFVAVKKKSTDEIGLFDDIEKKFYSNMGTGEFIAGPEIAE